MIVWASAPYPTYAVVTGSEVRCASGLMLLVVLQFCDGRFGEMVGNVMSRHFVEEDELLL